MKRFTFIMVCMLLSLLTFAQNYNFNGTISRQVLDNYLERAITMQTLSAIQGVGNQSEFERQRDIDMLDDIDAKFIGRIGGWWENGWGQTNHDNFFDKVQLNVSDVHANDAQVICQAAVFEYVSGTIETFWIPQRVWDEFGITAPANHRLDYEAMLYPAPASQYKIYGRNMTESERTWIPDITQTATQMWIYYMATRYISVGCEAIHFGQAEIMNRRDIGNRDWWELIERIREYADTRNRGVVVCDAHVPSGGMYYEPSLSMSQSAWQSYSYPPGWNKQLLWDFHSIWVGYEETSGCTSSKQPVLVNPDPNHGLHQRSLGGKSPQGWHAVSNPYLVELDNGGVGTQVGCSGAPAWFLYGWDEISWFASQPNTYRNDVLKYTYYKIKCMDKNGHFIVPGRRNINLAPGQAEQIYRANTGNYNQQQTIKNLWNGNFGSTEDWVRMDFSDNFVSNSPNPGIAHKSLIFVGSNKMYYIGTDQRIHGYVKYGNVWLTTSPSYAAGNVNGQVKAAGDLIANPSGTELYYRGVNGFVYKFKINSIWSYTYSAMPTNTAMSQQNIRAFGSLICTADNRIYYVANELGNGSKKRIHGFIKWGSTWLTTSPSWSANSNGTPINSQQQAAPDLVANPSGTWLYYRGTNGFVYRYKINSSWSYTYSAMPTNTSMSTQGLRATGPLVCPTDNRIYYIAKELTNGSQKRIHGFIQWGSSWLTTSPSWAAHGGGQNINTQQIAKNKLACSPDNKTIAYLGSNNQMQGFEINSDWSYTYFRFKNAVTAKRPHESVSFNQDDKLFYIASNFSGDDKVHCYNFEDDHCENPAVQAEEPNCCMYAVSNNHGKAYLAQHSERSGAAPQALEGNTDFALSVFPNPSHQQDVNLVVEGLEPFSEVQVSVLDFNGKIQFSMDAQLSPAPLRLRVKDLPNGFYLVKVNASGVSQTTKLVIAN